MILRPERHVQLVSFSCRELGRTPMCTLFDSSKNKVFCWKCNVWWLKCAPALQYRTIQGANCSYVPREQSALLAPQVLHFWVFSRSHIISAKTLVHTTQWWQRLLAQCQRKKRRNLRVHSVLCEACRSSLNRFDSIYFLPLSALDVTPPFFRELGPKNCLLLILFSPLCLLKTNNFET